MPHRGLLALSEDVLVAMIGEVLLVFRGHRQWMLLNILQSLTTKNHTAQISNSAKVENPCCIEMIPTPDLLPRFHLQALHGEMKNF